MNYFKIFSLSSQYDVDLGELEKRYIEIQKSTPPDKLANNTAEERFIAFNNSIDINNAYSQLKDPLLRAKNLLFLKNINIDQEIRKNVTPAILAKSFSEREQLEEIIDNKMLRLFLATTKKTITEIVDELSSCFEKNDIKGAITSTINLQYKTKLLSEIKVKLKKLR